ncbi:hypothetical protein KKA49_02625 [Patescibacteria group bacterium]|nr:hypothetical protein [Patescibacteria group bacterium]
MKKIKKEKDRLLLGFDSPLMDDMDMNEDVGSKDIVISGNLGIGEKGNPVTIVIEDEITGESLEINHVGSAFVVVEDKRRSSSGWLAVAVGGVEKLNQVLGFLAGITLDGLNKMMKKN